MEALFSELIPMIIALDSFTGGVKKNEVCNFPIFVIYYLNQSWVALLRLGVYLRFCHPPTLAGG